jgi:hypothetical protein
MAEATEDGDAELLARVKADPGNVSLETLGRETGKLTTIRRRSASSARLILRSHAPARMSLTRMPAGMGTTRERSEAPIEII